MRGDSLKVASRRCNLKFHCISIQVVCVVLNSCNIIKILRGMKKYLLRVSSLGKSWLTLISCFDLAKMFEDSYLSTNVTLSTVILVAMALIMPLSQRNS